MENAGSSIISALGAGSGVNFTQLATDISAASFAAQRNSLTARQTALEAQISAAGQLRGAAPAGSRVLARLERGASASVISRRRRRDVSSVGKSSMWGVCSG